LTAEAAGDYIHNATVKMFEPPIMISVTTIINAFVNTDDHRVFGRFAA